jgi:cytochrome c-type protein NapC
MLLTASIVIGLVLLVALAARPSLSAHRWGRTFAFVAIIVVPVGVGFGGLSAHIERSKTVTFCLSCHVMEPFGKSLHVDDLDHVPAHHWQYGRVDRETACFTCHTDYTMYGDYNAKLRGLHHVWAQYVGTVPAPEKIKLYTAYNNRECLHCHSGARSFEEGAAHADKLAAIRKNELSCISSGCHNVVHTVDKVATLPMWSPPAGSAP